MKKFVSVALVLCMVLALIPAMAFAATPVAMVGETGYATVQAAIDAASAPDSTSNRVDIVGPVKEDTIVIKSDIVIQLNGNTVSGKSGTYGSYPFDIVGPNASLTIQGPGEVQSYGPSDTAIALANAGKLTLKSGVKITGIIYNTGSVTHGAADLYGYYDNKGTVTVNDGSIHVPADTATQKFAAFMGTGEATVNMGLVIGRLDDYNPYTGSCAGVTVNGGAFTDVHVVGHTSAPVAGATGPDIPGTPDSPNGYKQYWVGATAITTYAKAYVTKTTTGNKVDFLFGDVKVDGMPTSKDGWEYWDSWDSYYNSAEKKELRYSVYVDGDPVKCDGRGLVNSRSDLNITADEHDVATSGNQIADSVMNRNAQYVQSVKAVCTGVNKNEVFYNIEITVDLDKLTEFEVPEGFSGFGNKNGSHQWVPITLEFTDLNGKKVSAPTDVSCRDAWNTAFAYQTSADGHFHLWIGVDHVLLGSNSSWDFADMRYYNDSVNGAKHGLIYRCTIVVKDKDGNVPENSEPDDTTGAAAIPSASGNGSTPAASGTGTGNGDGPAKTGDNSTVMLWATLLVASAAGVAICVVDEAKKRSRK